MVPDGSYTIKIVATNDAGKSTLTYQRQVASGTPGQLTTPTAGATLSGTTGFAFTPNSSFTDTFPISQVSDTCTRHRHVGGENGPGRAVATPPIDNRPRIPQRHRLYDRSGG